MECRICRSVDDDNEIVCSDCSIVMCNKCNNDDDILCKCYGTCDSCECDINRGSDGWPCMDCHEWLCYDCKMNSECSRCGPGKSSDSDNDDANDDDDEDDDSTK